jgi:hypothetical protein
MPHVVIEGAIDLAAFARDFEPILVRPGRDVERTERIWLERDGRALLIEGVVVESGRRQQFYVMVSTHGRGTATVRIDPMTHPERSEGVRDLVARIAGALLARTPGARVSRSNVVIPSGPHEGMRGPSTGGGPR